MRTRLIRIPAVSLLVLLLCVLLAACSLSKADNTVTIASKQFTENILMSEMYAQLIENLTELKVTRKQNMGTTAVCFTAMEGGEVDIYVEYTGTIYNEILGYTYDPSGGHDGLYELIKREMEQTKGVTLFGMIGPNNTFALAMLRAKAESMGIETMSDLSAVSPQLIFAANDLYYTRFNDGYDTMVERYGYRFKSVVKMGSAMLYDAAADDRVDVIVVYTTDSLLAKYEMQILQDDKQMFPDYYALPIIRGEVLLKHPELSGILNLLEDSIDNELMQKLNYMVDIEQQSPEDVVKQFLTERGLIHN